MKFRNTLEQEIFEVFGSIANVRATVEHNKVVAIEDTTHVATATFSGPPKKEIDVLKASFGKKPNLLLLVSCKSYSQKAEPVDIQEWAAVTSAMNKYANRSEYLGVVICPAGFTSGCEGWATMHNIALIPIVNTSVNFSYGSILRMTHRLMSAIDKRLAFPYESLLTPPTFYDFCYHLLDGFQNRERYVQERFGNRFVNLKWQMPSTFSEMVREVKGLKIVDLDVDGPRGIKLSEDYVVQCDNTCVYWGPQKKARNESANSPRFTRFTSHEPCEQNLVRGAVMDQRIVSLGDWGHTLEIGLQNHVNLSMDGGGFNIDYDPPVLLSAF